MKTPKVFYRRNLPHIHPPRGTFFITYLLHGAIPKPLLEKLKRDHTLKINEIRLKGSEAAIDDERKRYFGRFDQALHRSESSPFWLRKKEVSQIVKESLHFWDGRSLELVCYCIMPNHVHVLFTLLPQISEDNPNHLQHIMESIKKYSAVKCNALLNRKGQPFWQHESYDRVVRDRKELFNIIAYVLDNPIKAGLCKGRSEWEWSYISPKYNEFM